MKIEADHRRFYSDMPCALKIFLMPLRLKQEVQRSKDNVVLNKN